MKSTAYTFGVRPTSIKGYSLIEWDIIDGLPRRSLQVETEIAELWARAGTLLDELSALERELKVTLESADSMKAAWNAACVEISTLKTILAPNCDACRRGEYYTTKQKG